MSVTTTPTTPGRPGPVGPPRRSGRRTVLAVIGALMIAVAAFAGAASIGLIAAFGTHGSLDTGYHTVSGSGAALVTDVATLQNTRAVSEVTGDPTLRLHARTDHGAPVFVGIGPADAVDRYLAGTATDQVTDLRLHPFAVTTTHHGGAPTVAAPARQTFWVASAVSTSDAPDVDLSWRMQDGDYRFVVMNADGSSDVAALTRIQLTLPAAFPISIAILIGSAVIGVAGTVLVVVAVARAGRPRPTTTG
jgi:hypothetical protein